MVGANVGIIVGAHDACVNDILVLVCQAISANIKFDMNDVAFKSLEKFLYFSDFFLFLL
jgi:hypothetical protein